MPETSIREILKKADGFEFALLTTFNFDFPFFERDLLPILWSRRIQKVSLFVDAEQFAAATHSVKNGSSALGRNYMVSPVRIYGAFHPKVILLLGRARAKVIVGSANLTMSGYFLNGEVFSVIDYDEKHSEGLGAIMDAIRFFEQLFAHSHQLDKELFDEIKQLLYYGKSTAPSERLLLTNVERPLINQIKEIIPEVSAIEIAVPYYDNQLAALSELHLAYPAAVIRLHLQTRKCRIMKEAVNSLPYVEAHIYKDYEIDEKTYNRFFHGKVLCFTNSQESLIVYGSANCTESALLKTPDDSGNIECVIADKGTHEEFAPFYERFITECEPLESEPLVYQTKPRNRFVFRYGLLKENAKNIELFFDHYSGVIKKIMYGETALAFSENDGALTVLMPIDSLEPSVTVFDVGFHTTESDETVTCWFINVAALKKNRLLTTMPSGEIDYNAAGDKYAQDMQRLLSGLILTAEEAQRAQSRKAAVEGTPQLSDEEDDASGGIVSYVPPSIDVENGYRIDKIIARIIEERSRHYSALVRLLPHDPQEAEVKPGKGEKENDDGTSDALPAKRAATTEEKRLSRYYKLRLKNLLSGEFLSIASVAKVIDASIIFLEMLDRFTFIEPVNDVFQPAFAAETKARIVDAFLGKCSPETDDEQNKKAILLAVDSILKNRYLEIKTSISSGAVDSANRTILRKLEQRFHLRESIEGFTLENALCLSVLNAINCGMPCLSYQYGMKYLDELYGYKRWDDVLATCRKEYGNNVQIIKDKETIIGHAVMNILPFRIPEVSFFELRRYAVNNGIKRIKMVISAVGERKGPDPAIEVVYDIDLRNNRGKQIVRSAHTEREEPFFVWS